MNKFKPYFITVLIIMLIFISCNSNKEEDTNTSTATDIAGIESTLTTFSKAISAADTTALQKLVSPNFVLLDEGKDFDFALMIQQIKTIHNMGTMTRKPQISRTVIHKDVAWSYYQVAVNYRTQLKSVDFNLLESAVLEKTDGGWKIAMMTTVPQAAK